MSTVLANKIVNKIDIKTSLMPDDFEINTRALNFKNKRYSISLSGQEDIWVYNDKFGYFEPNGEELLNDTCFSIPGWNHIDIAKRMVSSVRAVSRISENEFNSPSKGYINLLNGVISILDFDDDSDENLIPHSPEYRFKYCLPFCYDSKEDCPNFKQLLDSMFEEEDRKKIITWIAYHLYRGDKESKSLFIEGQHSTGKGIVCDIIKNIMGPENCNFASFKDLSEDLHYSVANLYGKLANIDYDLSYKAIKDTGMFKKLTSGEPVTVRKIRGKPFTLIPNIRFTFACNKLPYLSDDIIYDDAFWRRVIVVQTHKTYTEKDRMLYTNIFNEHAGIFNLIFKELRRMMKSEKHIFEDIDYRKEWIYSMWKWKYDDENKESGGDEYDTMMKDCETNMLSIDEINKTKQLTIKEIKKRALTNKINADIRKKSMEKYA